MTLCLSLWLGTSAYSNDKTAAEALTEILPRHCLLSADFRQIRRLHELPAPLISSGQLFFSCHDGLIWKTDIPFNETLIYTLQNQHFQIKEDEQPQLLKSNLHDNIAKILLSFMSADKQYLEKNFTLDNNSDGRKSTSITLKPKNKRLKRALNKITLQQQNNVNTMKMFNANQETTQIAISNMRHLDWENNSHTQSSCIEFGGKTSLACDVLLQPQNHLPTN